jgi:short-subunit dehydrogenase
MASSKPVVLVTGGSSGIGLELAKVFAEEGHDLIIASDNRAKLKKAAEEIALAGDGTRVDIVVADLAKPAGAQKLYDAVKELGRKVDILVNNAGRGVWGEFARETDLKEELEIIQLNAASVVAVTKLFVADMLKRRRGKILITASEASLAPIALMSVYAATKAFVYSFALSLREELKDAGITVSALLPGATQTDFFLRADMEDAKFVQEGKMADPAKVARDGYDALMKGDDHVVTPFKDAVRLSVAKLMPDRWTVERLE